MKGICAISLDKDKTFISFARLKKTCLTFLNESEVPIAGCDNNIVPFLKDNLEIIDQKIREAETKYSCRCEKVFLELPWAVAKERKVEGIVTLKSRKKIISDRKSTRLNSSHTDISRMPSSA